MASESGDFYWVHGYFADAATTPESIQATIPAGYIGAGNEYELALITSGAGWGPSITLACFVRWKQVGQPACPNWYQFSSTYCAQIGSQIDGALAYPILNAAGTGIVMPGPWEDWPSISNQVTDPFVEGESNLLNDSHKKYDFGTNYSYDHTDTPIVGDFRRVARLILIKRATHTMERYHAHVNVMFALKQVQYTQVLTDEGWEYYEWPVGGRPASQVLWGPDDDAQGCHTHLSYNVTMNFDSEYVS